MNLEQIDRQSAKYSKRQPTSLSGAVLTLANQISNHTPLTRAFWIRRYAFQRAGVGIHSSVRICGTATIQHPNVIIEEGTWIGSGCCLIATAEAAIRIGRNCDLGPAVLLVTGTHDLGGPERRAGAGRSESISIGAGTWVGARATFVAGGRVGSGCIVGAGSLVRETFGNDLLIAGVPARAIRALPH